MPCNSTYVNLLSGNLKKLLNTYDTPYLDLLFEPSIIDIAKNVLTDLYYIDLAVQRGLLYNILDKVSLKDLTKAMLFSSNPLAYSAVVPKLHEAIDEVVNGFDETPFQDVIHTYFQREETWRLKSPSVVPIITYTTFDGTPTIEAMCPDIIPQYYQADANYEHLVKVDDKWIDATHFLEPSRIREEQMVLLDKYILREYFTNNPMPYYLVPVTEYDELVNYTSERYASYVYDDTASRQSMLKTRSNWQKKSRLIRYNSQHMYDTLTLHQQADVAQSVIRRYQARWKYLCERQRTIYSVQKSFLRLVELCS